MRLQDMHLLVRVAQTGSMTEAARQLHLTPAAVSSAIQRIEAELDLRVFERTTRSLHATEEGQVILRGCERLLAEWQHTLDDARDHHADLSGTVHVSAPSDSAYSLIGTVIANLCETHERLRVELDISDALQHVHREALDITIRYGALQDSTLVAHKLAAEPNVLVASPAYLRASNGLSTAEDLRDHRLLTLRIRGQPATDWELNEEGRKRLVDVHSPMCSDGHQVRLWALEGRGIALKNLLDVIDDLESGRLVRVLPDLTGRIPPIHAVFPSRKQPARVRVVHSAIQRAYAERSARCSRWLAK